MTKSETILKCTCSGQLIRYKILGTLSFRTRQAISTISAEIHSHSFFFKLKSTILEKCLWQNGYMIRNY